MTIYKIENKINGKVYIGQTVQSLSKRWTQHKKYLKIHKFNLYNAMRKYGVENFTIEMLIDVRTKEELDYMEIYFISIYDSTNPEKGYNMTSGGEGIRYGYKHTNETKAKMSKCKTGVNNGQYKGPIQCVETGEIFIGTKALKDAGFTPKRIYECITGERKSYRGKTYIRLPKELTNG